MSKKTKGYTEEIIFYPEERTQESIEIHKVNEELWQKAIASGKYKEFNVPDDKRRERRFTIREKREIADLWQQKLGPRFTFDEQLFKEGSSLPYYSKGDLAVFIRIVGPIAFIIHLQFDYEALLWSSYYPRSRIIYLFSAGEITERYESLVSARNVGGIYLPEVIFDETTKCSKKCNKLNIDIMKQEFTLEDFHHYYSCKFLATEYLVQSKNYNLPDLIRTFGYDIYTDAYNNIKRPMPDGRHYRDAGSEADHMAKIASWTGNLKKAKEYLDWGYEIYSRERYSQEDMKTAEVIEDCNNWYNQRKYLIESPEQIRSIVRKNIETPFHCYSEKDLRIYKNNISLKNLQYMPLQGIG